MADRKLSFNISATDDTSSVLAKISGNAKQEMGKLDAAFDESKSKGQQAAEAMVAVFEGLDAQLTETKAAADILGQAMGPELSAKIDATSAVGEFQRMGLSLDDVKADADALAAALKAADDVTMKHFSGEVDAAGASMDGLRTKAGDAAGGLDQVRDSGDQSKSVMANLVGNSVQDLGQLGGVAGTAGMALGQLGEYATEGNIKMGQLVQLAGPMLLVGLAVQQVSGHMKEVAETKAWHTAQIDGFVDSIREGEDAAKGLAERLTEAGAVEFRVFGRTEDITGQLADAGVTVEQFSELVTGGRDKLDEWAEASRNAGVDAESLDVVVGAAGQQQDDYAQAQVNAAIQAQVFGTATGDAAVAVDDAADAADGAVTSTDNLATSIGAAWDVAGNFAQGMDDAKVAAHDAAVEAQKAADEGFVALKDAMAGEDWGKADIDGAMTAMQSYTTELNALTTLAADKQAAMDGFAQSIADNGFNFDVSTEAGRNNQSALLDVAGAIDTELADAYANADGDMGRFKDSANEIANRTLEEMRTSLGLSQEEVDLLREKLGLTDGDWEARFALSGDEEAKVKIGLLQGAIDGLPKDVQAKVTQQIIAGDYQGALRTVQGYYDNHPANVDVDARQGEVGSVWGSMQRYFNNNPLSVAVNPRPVGLGVPLRAGGGRVGDNEPLTIVGEGGPELVSLPAGSMVHTASETRSMIGTGSPAGLSAGVGGGPIINLTVNAGMGTNGPALGRQIAEVLEQHYRRNGRSSAA